MMLGPIPVLTATALLAAVVAGCADSEPAATTAAPAKVTNPVAEADLTSITLSEEAEKRLAIETVEVAVRRVERTRTVGGEVTVPSDSRVTVSAPIAGVLSAPPGGVPRAGSAIRRGQAVFRLLPIAPAERDVRLEAEREAAEAEARATAARARTARAEQLLKDGAGSARSVEEARAELDVAEATLKSATERMALAARGPQSARGDFTIESPLAGHLQKTLAGAGQTVAASAPLFEVAKLDPVWVRVPLYVGDLEAVDSTKAAGIVDLGERSGSVARAARRTTAPPSADPQLSSSDLFYELPNADGALIPGQRVGVRLPLRTDREGPVVPASAILHDMSGGAWVYEMTAPRTYVRRRVDIEDEVGDVVVLRRGPAAGARVVTVGAPELFGTEFGAGK